MPASPIERGEAAYNRLNPVKQDFFDGIAERLCEAEVLFNKDVWEIAQEAGLRCHVGEAAQVLLPKKSHNILQYLNIFMGREYFTDGHDIRKRVSYFDLQFSPDKLRIGEAVEAIYGDQYQASLSFVNEGIETWRDRVEQQHTRYLASLVAQKPPEVVEQVVPIRRGGITIWARRTINM